MNSLRSAQADADTPGDVFGDFNTIRYPKSGINKNEAALRTTPNLKLIVITLPANKLVDAIKLLGRGSVTNFANSYTDETVLLAGTIDEDKIDMVPGNIVAKQDPGTAVIIDRTKWAEVGSIERGNRSYSVTAVSDYDRTPAFGKVMKLVADKTLPAFDTVFGHVNAPKATWPGLMKLAPHRLQLDGEDVVTSRFGFHGLIMTAKDDTLRSVPWIDLFAAFADAKLGTIALGPVAETIYNFDAPVVSLSHIPETTVVANLANGTKDVLDLKPLYAGKAQTATFVAKDASMGNLAFVGQLAYDETAPDYTAVDTSDNELPKVVRIQKDGLTVALQSYASTPPA